MKRRIKRRCKCGCGTIVSCGNKWFRGHQHRGKKYTSKHGLVNHKLYRKWLRIKSRCYNPNSHNYKYYGKKNIRVCIRWRMNFKSFYNWAIKNGYKEYLHIHRIENDKNYNPNNCCFMTHSQHSVYHNKSRT